MAPARITLVALSLLLVACTATKFAVANLAAKTEPATRTADIAFGPDPRQQLDVYTPSPAHRSAAMPVIVFVHGGGWDAGSKDRYQFVGMALAARGYIAVLPNYRLFPQVRFPAFVEDTALAVAWTRAHAVELGGDSRHLFLMGHSAGAQIVMLLGLDAHYLRGVGLETGAISGVIGLSGPYDFLPFGRGFNHAVFDTGTDLKLTQPVHFARGDAPPVLLLYGSADQTVEPRNSESLAAALRAAGGRVTLKRYQGRSHEDTVAAFSDLKAGRVPVRDDVDGFVAGVLAPR
jgi:acetyl esterase/lipase